LNLVLGGGLVGGAIDWFTGAFYKYNRRIYVDLAKDQNHPVHISETDYLRNSTKIAENAQKIAVFDATGIDDKDKVEIAREIIQTTLIQYTNTSNERIYAVLEREKIDIVLKENKYQFSGLVNESELSEVGKQLGADLVCVSVVKKLNNTYFVSCRLIEVETALAKTAATYRNPDLFNAIEGAINKMLRN